MFNLEFYLMDINMLFHYVSISNYFDVLIPSYISFDDIMFNLEVYFIEYKYDFLVFQSLCVFNFTYTQIIILLSH